MTARHDHQAAVLERRVVQCDPAGDHVEIGVREEDEILVPADLGSAFFRLHVELGVMKLDVRADQGRHAINRAIVMNGATCLIADVDRSKLERRRLGRYLDEIEDDRDHLTEIQEILERLEDSESDQVGDDVYQKRRYDLCPECHREFIKNPVGRERTAPLGFSPN